MIDRSFIFSLSQDLFIKFIFTLTLISFLIDVFTNPCFNKSLDTLDTTFDSSIRSFGMLEFLYFHHLLAVILYFGWLSPSRTFLGFYILFVILIISHWMTNNQKCILTQIINRHCNYDDDERFHDLFYILNLKSKSWFDKFMYIYLFFAFVLSLYKVS
jgi:hypothetical protein